MVKKNWKLKKNYSNYKEWVDGKKWVVIGRRPAFLKGWYFSSSKISWISQRKFKTYKEAFTYAKEYMKKH